MTIPTPTERFSALMADEQGKLADLEAEAAGAQAALEGADSALVRAKLDGATPADQAALERASQEAHRAVAEASHAVARQRAHLAQLEEAGQVQLAQARIAEAEQELADVQQAWPRVRDAAVEALDGLAPLWAAVNDVARREQVAQKRLLDALAEATWLPAAERTVVPAIIPAAAAKAPPAELARQREALSIDVGASRAAEQLDAARRRQAWEEAVELDEQSRARMVDEYAPSIERLHG